MVKLTAIRPCKIVPIIKGKRITFDFTTELSQDIKDKEAINVLLNTGLFEDKK